MSEFSEQMNGVREKIALENKQGGELKDKRCPFCGKPRSQRSFYVRCQPCGINWVGDADLDKHPHIKRQVTPEKEQATTPLTH